MALHRLTSITLGVPDVDASQTFFDDFGLTTGDGGWMHTRDGGAQLELAPDAHRRLRRIGVGATDPDDLAQIAARVESTGLGAIVESTDERLVLSEPVTGLPVEITVADEGRGVPPELREKIFEPFYTTDSGRAGGLGLAITRRLIAEAGGDICVDGREEGGAEFLVHLPIAKG